MNRQKKEEQKKTMRTITTTEPGLGSLSTTFIPWNMSLVPFPATPTVATPKKENTMYFDMDTDHGPARNRLVSRLTDASHAHDRALRKHYFIEDTDISEWSVKDAIKAINDGQFIFRDENTASDKGSYYYRGLDIRFRDPNKPADREGYEKARKTMYEHVDSVMDHIAIAEPKDALKKVDAFREHTFH